MFVKKRMLGIALVALLAPLFSLLSPAGGATAAPAPAAASAPAHTSTAERGSSSPCHGYVYSFKKVKTTIRMTYWVYCTRRVDYIQVNAFIREGDRWSYGGLPKECENAYVCEKSMTMKDKAGKQLYGARAVEGGDLSGVTYVRDGRHDLWGCGTGSTSWGNPMPCGGAGHTW